MQRMRALSATRLPRQHVQSSNVLRLGSSQRLLILAGMVVPWAGAVKAGNLCRGWTALESTPHDALTAAPRRSVDSRGRREIRMKSLACVLGAALALFSLGC